MGIPRPDLRMWALDANQLKRIAAPRHYLGRPKRVPPKNTHSAEGDYGISLAEALDRQPQPRLLFFTAWDARPTI